MTILALRQIRDFRKKELDVPDFFQDPIAMQEMDDSAARNLAVEAMAELNSAERNSEQTIEIYRSVGEKFLKICELKGHGAKAWIARTTKRDERQVGRIIQLAESPDNLPVEEQIAILWGNPVKQAGGGSGRGAGSSSPTVFNRQKLFGGINRVVTHAKAFANENSLAEEAAFKAILKAAETIEAKFKELEKKAGK